MKQYYATICAIVTAKNISSASSKLKKLTKKKFKDLVFVETFMELNRKNKVNVDNIKEDQEDKEENEDKPKRKRRRSKKSEK